MRIAVDFDGTIVEHRYPEIGTERPMATMTLRKLQEDGHQLILWSVREGELLEEAVEWCKERGVVFYAVNANFPGEDVEDAGYSRKIVADIYIDDRNVGMLPHWSIIYQLLTKKQSMMDYVRSEMQALSSPMQQETPKKHWWNRK